MTIQQFTHTNAQFIDKEGCKESYELREAIRLQSKYNYQRTFRKNEAEKAKLANMKASYKATLRPKRKAA